MRVPLIAADPVDCALRKPDDVEGIEGDLGLRDRVTDRLLITARHVDRDGLDRVAALAELIEERLQGGGVAARGAPHDRPGLVVDDARQVAVVATIGDLVDADRHEALQASLIQVVGHDALYDLPDGVPGDPQQAGDRLLGHLLRQPRHHILEVARVARAGPGPGHRLKARATV